MKSHTDDSFRRELRRLLSVGGMPADNRDQTKSLMRAFLDFGSETPDNINCSMHIEYGNILGSGKSPCVGLKIRQKNIGFADLANVLENVDLPEDVAKEFPSLTKEEWDAFTRMVTMIMLALQSE